MRKEAPSHSQKTSNEPDWIVSIIYRSGRDILLKILMFWISLTPCYVVKTLTNYQYLDKDETFSNYLRKVQIFSVHWAHEELGFCYIAEFSMKVSYVKHSWEKENFRYKKVFVLGILIVVRNKDLEDASMCIFNLVKFLKLLANHHCRLYFIRKKENYWQFSLLPVSMILLRWYHLLRAYATQAGCNCSHSFCT